MCGTISYPKTRREVDLAKNLVEVIDMDGVKIDKVMVKSIICSVKCWYFKSVFLE
jgi:hypothetical protein